MKDARQTHILFLMHTCLNYYYSICLCDIYPIWLNTTTTTLNTLRLFITWDSALCHHLMFLKKMICHHKHYLLSFYHKPCDQNHVTIMKTDGMVWLHFCAYKFSLDFISLVEEEPSLAGCNSPIKYLETYMHSIILIMAFTTSCQQLDNIKQHYKAGDTVFQVGSFCTPWLGSENHKGYYHIVSTAYVHFCNALNHDRRHGWRLLKASYLAN